LRDTARPDKFRLLGRLDHHLCGKHRFRFADLHFFIDTGIRVCPDTPVNAQDGKPDILGKARPDNRRRGPFSHDLDDVARHEPELFHYIDTQPCNSPACVVVRRLFNRYFEEICTCHRRPVIFLIPLI